jgi:DNA primase
MYGSPVDVRRKDLHINCPFGVYHSKGVDTSQGLSVKIQPGQKSPCYCFSCGTTGTLSYVFEKAAELDSSLVPVAEFIRQRDGASLSGSLARLHRKQEEDETPNTDWASYASRCARKVPLYLIERGIIKLDIKRWQLGFDEHRQRAIFPVRDEHGKVIGCLRRSLHEGQNPKYKDTPGAATWKKTVFYGEHLIDRTNKRAILVEGPMGTIFASRTERNVLGMMGANTGCGPERIDKLIRWGIRECVLLLDADKAGQDAVYGKWTPKGEFIEGLKSIMRPHMVVKVAKLPEGEDPDDVVRRDPTALRQIIRAAAYLEPDRRLTGGSAPVTFTTPKKGSQSFSQYLKDRRGG